MIKIVGFNEKTIKEGVFGLVVLARQIDEVLSKFENKTVEVHLEDLEEYIVKNLDRYNLIIKDSTGDKKVYREEYSVIGIGNGEVALKIQGGYITLLDESELDYIRLSGDRSNCFNKARISIHKRLNRFVLTDGTLLHRLISEAGVGEEAHHINCCKADNRSKNMINVDKKTHKMLHKIKSKYESMYYQIVESIREETDVVNYDELTRVCKVLGLVI